MESTNFKIDIGNRIHEYRIKEGMTQAQFSERIDISVNFLSELENGKKGLFCETLCNICKGFSISADYILLGKEPDKFNFPRLVEITNALSDNELLTLREYVNALIKMKGL